MAADQTTLAMPPLYTFEEIAERYGFSLRRMKAEATAGTFDCIHFGKAWRMTPGQLDAFLAVMKPKATGQLHPDPLDKVRQRISRGRRAA